MLRPVKKICTLGILPLAIVLWNCTTDGDKITVGEDELSGVYLVDNDVFDEPDEDEDEEAEELESSSSAKDEKKSKSSSSKKSSAKSSSSSESTDSDDDDEDGDEEDDEDISSSSTANSSSSVRRIKVPGIDDSDGSSSSKAKSSSSKAKSSSSKTAPSSSNEESDAPSLTEVDSAAFESMEKLDKTTQKEINKLITNNDSTIQKTESTYIDLSSLDFEQSDYVCKSYDGNWYLITERTLESIIEAIFHKTNIKITKEYMFSFSNLCDEIYIITQDRE